MANAERLYRRALEARESVLSPVDQMTLSSLNNLALCLTKLGKLDEAEPLYRRSLAGQVRTRGADNRNTINTEGNLGVLLMRRSASAAEGRAIVENVLNALRSPPHSLPETSHFIKKFSKALGR